MLLALGHDFIAQQAKLPVLCQNQTCTAEELIDTADPYFTAIHSCVVLQLYSVNYF